MAKARNAVIAGDFGGKKLACSFGKVSLNMGFGSIPIDKTTIAAYEVITDEHRKSAASGVARGLVGGVLLGPVGMLAGGITAKSKGIYQVALQFVDDPKATYGGKRSLVEVDDAFYKAIVKSCF